MKISLSKTRVVIFFVIIIVTVFLGFLYNKTSTIKPNIASFDEFQEEKKTYELAPENNYVSPASFEYPTVQTKPNISLKYQLIQVIEKQDLKLKKYSSIFFARKRVAELVKWGKEFDYQTWETILNDYYDTMEQAIHIVLTSKIETLQIVESNRLTLSSQIYSLITKTNLNEKEKKQLFALADTIDKALMDYIKPKLSSRKIDATNYSLRELQNDKEFGQYQATIPIDEHSSILLNSQLLVDNEKYYGNIDQENNQLIFNDLIINPKSELIIKYPTTNIVKQKNWTEQERQLETDPYVYSKLIENLDLNTTYQVNIKYNFPNNVLFQIRQEYASQSAKLNWQIINQSLYDENIISHTQFFKINRQFTAPKIKQYITKTYMTLQSVKPLDLSQFNVTLYPVYFPTVTLTKTGPLPKALPKINLQPLSNQRYQLSFINSTVQQEQFILQSLGFGWKAQHGQSTKSLELGFWPRLVLGYFLLFSLLSMFFYGNYSYLKLKKPEQTNWVERLFSYKTYGLIVTVIKWPFQLLGKIIRYLSISAKLFWFVISIAGILLDIFLFKKNSDLLTTIFTFTWIFSMVGYKSEARTSFTFALGYLVLCPFLLIFKLDFIAEKAAIWTYMMLVVGTVQSIFELKTNPKNLLNPYQTIIKILNDLSIFVLIKQVVKSSQLIATVLVKLLYKILKLIKKLLGLIINYQPKNIYDIVFNFIKIIILIMIIFSLSYISLHFANQARINHLKKQAEIKRQQLWNNTRPIVDLVEPPLVYRGMKVVVYGRNFGWKQEPIIHIRQDGYEIKPDEIIDSRMIFSIPLETPYGKLEFYVTKPVTWDGKQINAKTQMTYVTVLPVTEGFTPNDQKFFDLLPSLKPETRKINGYE